MAYAIALVGAEHKSMFKLAKDTHISPSRASYGVYLVNIFLEKDDCVITVHITVTS